MKKAYKYFIPAALSVMALAGCGNEADQPQAPGRQDCPDFTATIGDVQSRAFDQTWESGDRIGITGSNRTNVCYTTTGNGNFRVEKSGDQIYFQDDNEADFSAYYPWNNLTGTTVIKADTRKQAEQKSFDFLYAEASGKKDAPNVDFKFAHKMAKLTITVKPGTGMSYKEAKTAKLSLQGCSHTGSFDVTDGSTTVDAAGDVWDFSEFAITDDAAETLSFSLILFPQFLGNPMEFKAVLELPDNNTHTLRAELNFTGANAEKDGEDALNEWVAGRQYNISVTLNKTDITVGDCNINPWTQIKGDEIIVD